VRVFLDANILFSAAYLDDGLPRRLFELADVGACELATSRYALEEARRNIAAKRQERLLSLESLVASVVVCQEPGAAAIRWAAALGLPSKDAPILAAAVESGCAMLVTGDKAHFGSLFGSRHRGTVVLVPADAVDLIIEA
jgi:predicted nucleic acid-binding protein